MWLLAKGENIKRKACEELRMGQNIYPTTMIECYGSFCVVLSIPEGGAKQCVCTGLRFAFLKIITLRTCGATKNLRQKICDRIKKVLG